MHIYKRTVQYHETDKMGITHHSNYVKYMEEARVSYLDAIGLPFTAIEEKGIVSPVAEIKVRYKSPSTFADTTPSVTRIISGIPGIAVISPFTGIRLVGSEAAHAIWCASVSR